MRKIRVKMTNEDFIKTIHPPPKKKKNQPIILNFP